MGVWCRIFFSFTFAVLIAMGSWTYARADAPNGNDSIVVGRVLLKPKQGIDAVRALSSLEDEEVRIASSLPQLGYLVLSVPPGTEREWARRLSSSAFVENAQPEFVYRLLLNPNDFFFSAFKGENSLYQWNLRTINAPSAWDINTGSSSLTIAIVDTGVDDRHEDLSGKVVLKADFINEDNPFDGLGFHGTHVAGIAAAKTNNAGETKNLFWNGGMAAVSWGAKIISVKVANHFGKAADTIAAQGIRYAADNGANIINLSFGGEEHSQLLQDAVDYAYSKGILVVAAAGNCADPAKFIQYDCTSLNPIIYPAAFINVLAVGAVNEQNQRPSFSEHRSYVAVVAPGDGIISTWPNQGFGYASGTSQAAPHVSALASLIWSVNPSLTNAQVANIITSTVTDLGPAGKDDDFGYGLIDAQAALVKASEPAPAPTPTPSPTPTPTPFPALSVSPVEIGALAKPNEAPVLTRTLGVSTGSVNLAWAAVAPTPAAWLSFSPISGTAPTSVTVSFDPNSRAAGLYQSSISLSAPGAQPSSASVTVTMRLTDTILQSFIPLAMRGSASGW